jgi:Predicted AAA-ATPase
MKKRNLPIGIQTFEKIRLDNCYYVDKTKHIGDLISQGTYFFISRPRRFGKSLLIDTVKCLFEGKRDLFKGLYIENHWDWSKTFPVIRISFGAGVLNSREQLDKRIADQLAEIRQSLQLPTSTALDLPGTFRQLIIQANNSYQERVVILVDEYDKPILDNILKPDTATEMREGLKSIYSVIKDSDAYVKFSLITGVSKFSKVNLFSGANNYQDITLTPEYSSICGYTDKDIDTVFAPELPGLDRDEIRRWYNGYNWRGESVYNPFDALLLFREREFKPFWFIASA